MSQKSAMITIVGRPNVGKSTLINHLVGEKIAIVSHKPQTTRNRICGIVTHDDTQLVFVDTPGFHKPRTRLGDYMNNVVHDSVADVDAALLLVEPIAHIGPQEEELNSLKELKHRSSLLSTRSTRSRRRICLPSSRPMPQNLSSTPSFRCPRSSATVSLTCCGSAPAMRRTARSCSRTI